MEDRKLLIVGIDPGITTAYAALDIEGKLIKTNSSKNFDLNQLISEIIKIGKVILVGTDKSRTPNLVYMFATKLGAKIISPNEDLKVDEKRKMILGFSFEDGHQADAIASALFAFKSAKPLFNKIDSFAHDSKKLEIKDRIKELVITKKIIVEKKLNEDDFLRFYNKLKNYEAEMRLIKMHNNNLKNRIKNLEKNKNNEIKTGKNDKLHDFRERRIISLENSVKSKYREIENINLIIRKLNDKISNISNFYVMKKLDTLGLHEFNYKNKVLNIKKNDLLCGINSAVSIQAKPWCLAWFKMYKAVSLS